MRTLFLAVCAACFLLSCCGPVFISHIDLARNLDWKPEKLVLNEELASFQAEGEISVLTQGDRYKVDYEMFCADPGTWRIDVFGPFHTHGATMIMQGITAHVFHDGVWEPPQPWPAISSSVFGMVLPYKVLSVMVGGRFEMNGECAETIEGKVCREYDLYYLLRRGELVEIKSETVDIIYSEETWRGTNDTSAEPFYLWPDKIELQTEFDPQMFQPKQEKDIFDDI